jgi:hypothetical protein
MAKNPLDIGAVRIPVVTGTAVAGAVTALGELVSITSESLSTAAAAFYTLTITNARVSASSTCFATVRLGGATAGSPVVTTVTPAAGSVVVIIKNVAVSDALNGTIKVDVLTINPA